MFFNNTTNDINPNYDNWLLEGATPPPVKFEAPEWAEKVMARLNGFGYDWQWNSDEGILEEKDFQIFLDDSSGKIKLSWKKVLDIEEMGLIADIHKAIVE